MLDLPSSDPYLSPCHYCGLASDSTDHVVPQSLILATRASGDEALIAAVEDRHRRMTVPSCRECNSLAGAVYDETLALRKQRVKHRLRVRYAETLAIPDWSPTELMELSERLRNRVISKLVLRDLVRRRMSW